MQKLNPDTPFYQISQVSKILEITSDRLRNYEQESLIKPKRTTATKDGKRLYSQNEIEWLILIRDLIKLGVSIPTIRILLLSKYPSESPKLKAKDLEIIALLKKIKAHPNYKKIFN